VIGVCDPCQEFFGDEDCAASLKWVRSIVQDEGAAAFEDVEGLIHMEVPVNWNACTDHYLLCAEARLSEPVAELALMKMFPWSRSDTRCSPPLASRTYP